MNHPPIPPKSFFRFDISEQILNRHERLVIAAVAEVEWLKRADRWHRLWGKVSDRYLRRRNGTTSHHRKTLQYQLDRTTAAQQKCDEIAEEWREWGAK